MQYKQLLDRISDGFVAFDASMNYTFVNEAGAKMLGKTPEELIGKNYWKEFPEAKGTPFANAYEKALISQEPIFIEACYEPWNRWFSNAIYPSHSGISIIFQEITDRKMAELALMNSRDNLQNFFNNNIDFLWVLSEDGNIIQINDTVKRRLGYSEDELLGKSLQMVYPLEFRHQVLYYVADMLLGKRENCDTPLQTKDGIEIPVETYIFKGYWDGAPALFGVSRDVSALKLSEEKFAKAFRNSPNMIGLSDLKTGEYVEVNQAFYDIMEYTPDEIAGKKVKELVRMEPSFREKALVLLKETGSIKGMETTLYTKTGRAVHVLLSAEIIRINDKEFNFTTGVDITDLKNAEKLLKESEARYRTYMDNAPLGVFVADQNGQYLEVNDEACSITGYSREELIGMKIMEVVDPESFDAASKHFKRLLMDGLATVVVCGRTKTAEKRWWKVLAVTISKDRFLGFHVDLTENRQTEDTLQKSKQRIESFLEISQVITSQPDQGTIMQMLVNNAIRIMGLESGAIYLLNDEKTIKLAATSPALPDDFPEEFRIAGLKDHPHIGRAFHTGKHVLLADASLASLTAAEMDVVRIRNLRSILYLPIMLRRKVIGVLILSSVGKTCIFTDEEIRLLQGFANQAAQVIENNRNYDSLKQHTLDLEQQVNMRKRIEQDLIIAKEKAEESDRLKTAFLQNMSHEVRTPLNSIIGFSELLSSPDIDAEKRKKFTDIIVERGWQLTTIIDDIITISSLETGQESLRTDTVDVNKLIVDQTTVFAQQACNNGLRLISSDLLKEEDAVVYADKTKLGQVFNNLIQNALRFTERGEIVLGVQRHDNQLWFFVRDTGIGIEKSKTSLIFDRFRQADDSIRVKFGGTGLGLSICKGYLALMDGDIWVESEPGKGSTFWFNIPFEPVSSIDEAISMKPAIEKEEKAIIVLVADDEEYNLLYLETLLANMAETTEMQVIYASNGQEAVNICRDRSVDIVLMDIKMPVMDGYTATKQIRTFKPHLPVIAQTAYALKSEMEQYGDVFDDYITKPFTMEKLREVFNAFFK